MKRLKTLLLGFLFGVGLTLWVNHGSHFDPFDFRVIHTPRFEIFLQQSIHLPFPMTPHKTEVWFHDLRDPKANKGWRYAGKVITEPFDLLEATILDDGKSFVLQFPWNARLISKDLEHWAAEYETVSN